MPDCIYAYPYYYTFHSIVKDPRPPILFFQKWLQTQSQMATGNFRDPKLHPVPPQCSAKKLRVGKKLRNHLVKIGISLLTN